MHDAIVGVLPIIDQALADCAGVVDDQALKPVALMRNRIMARLAYPDDVLLAALAGGTGSGKSSLFNAIAGEDLAPTGGVRPTTSRPQALVPVSRSSALTGYLDEIGIDDRVVRRGLEWLCMIDLPDTDSVEIEHRQRVESLLPRLDCVVWVVDPEKYRDAALHHGYLTPLASYQSQFLFVLNQSDRLRPDDLSRVKADLTAALVEDGIADPVVLDTAAQPAAGPTSGIEALLTHLQVNLGGGSVYEKLLIDLQVGCSSLLEATGGGSGVDFEARWEQVVDETVTMVTGGDLSRAGQQMAVFLERMADETGGELGRSIGDVALAAPAVVLGLGSAASPPQAGVSKPPRRSWWSRRQSAPEVSSTGDSPSAQVRATLETEVGDPVRGMLARKARALASISELTLALNNLARRSG